MNLDLKLYIRKLLIFFFLLFVFVIIVFNIIKNQISKNEFLKDPLKKIEKEIIRAANGDGIDFKESEQLINSLIIIYNRDIKPITDKMNEAESNN